MKNRLTTALVLAALILGSAVSAQTPVSDPMRPSYAKPVASSKTNRPRRAAAYRLQAVIGTTGNRVAVVNGRVLRIGDTLGTARLRHIGAHHIELQARGRRWSLRLPLTPLN